MEGPKRIYRMGQCWCEKPTHEDNKGYVPADLTDALAAAAEGVKPLISKTLGLQSLTWDELLLIEQLQQALAAYRGEK